MGVGRSHALYAPGMLVSGGNTMSITVAAREDALRRSGVWGLAPGGGVLLSVRSGEAPTVPHVVCRVRLMVRIRVFHTQDRGSIPLRGTSLRWRQRESA